MYRVRQPGIVGSVKSTFDGVSKNEAEEKEKRREV
jgi:hypothetical protein